MSAASLVQQLRASGETLTSAYPYAAWLGQHLLAQRSDWERCFAAEDPNGAALPLPQAKSYRFLAFVERHAEWLPEADVLLAAHIDACQGALLDELHNTADWFGSQEP